MRKSYYAILTFCFLFLGATTVWAQGTEDFESATSGDQTHSQFGATWTNTGGTNAGVLNPPVGFDELIVGSNGWFINSAVTSSTVAWSPAIGANSVVMRFLHAGTGTGTAEAFSNATCATTTGETVNSIDESTLTDPAPTDEGFVILEATTIACVTFTSVASGPGNGTAVDEFSFGTGLPVELTTFDAIADGQAVNLTWKTASEENNQGFEVLQKVGDIYYKIGFVEGVGTSSTGSSYTFRTKNLAPGTHSFRLRQLDFDGDFSLSATIEVDVELPEAFYLSPAYPNPFNPQTNFTLTLKQTQDVRVEVYDLLGRQVALLHDGALAADEAHEFTFDAAGLSSGIYLIRAVGNDFVTARQVTLLK